MTTKPAHSHHRLGFRTEAERRAEGRRAHDARIAHLAAHGVPVAEAEVPLIRRVLEALGHPHELHDGRLFASWVAIADLRGVIASVQSVAERYAAYVAVEPALVLEVVVPYLPAELTITQRGAPWIRRDEAGIELRVDGEVLLVDGQAFLAQAA